MAVTHLVGGKKKSIEQTGHSLDPIARTEGLRQAKTPPLHLAIGASEGSILSHAPHEKGGCQVDGGGGLSERRGARRP